MDNFEKSFAAILRRSWVMFLIRGIVAIAFGILTWLWPRISLEVLVLLFGAYALVDGLFALWTAIAGHKHHEDWWVLAIGGLLGIIVGVITFLAPGLTAIALLFYIAIWAVATGVLEIVLSIRLRKEIKGEWLAMVAGIASAVFGILLMLYPSAGALAVLWLIACYAIVFGVLVMVLAFRARRFASIVSL